MWRGFNRGAIAGAVAALVLVVGVVGYLLGRSGAPPQRAEVAAASARTAAHIKPVVAQPPARGPQATPSTTETSPNSTPPARHSIVLAACDQNIKVKAATTTCPFAQNAFYEYWHRDTYGDSGRLRAYSPAAGQWMRISCAGGDTITCRTHDRGLVRFPASAVAAYTVTQASRYAASPGTIVSAEPGQSAFSTDSSSSSSNQSPDDPARDPSFSDPSLDEPTLDDPTPSYSPPVNSDDYSNHDAPTTDTRPPRSSATARAALGSVPTAPTRTRSAARARAAITAAWGDRVSAGRAEAVARSRQTNQVVVPQMHRFHRAGTRNRRCARAQRVGAESVAGALPQALSPPPRRRARSVVGSGNLSHAA
jgi:hypothetical protein